MAASLPAPVSSLPAGSAVAIIGAGIGGLVTAWHLERAGVPYDLFEADANTLGGAIRSRRIGPYLLETGPNSLQLTPALAELIEAVGLTPDVVETAAVSKHRFLLRDGRLQKLPGSPPALLASGYFGVGTKLRLLTELLRRPGPVTPDTTLSAFVRDRFGADVVEYALAPFVAGVWAGDPDRLLLRETMPRLADLATQYGSLVRGLIKTAGSTGRRPIVSLRQGAEQLPLALAADLHHLHVGTAVRTIRRRPADGGYELTLATGAAPRAAYGAVVLGLPAYAAAPLLAADFPAFAAHLAAVRHPPMAGVYLAYPRAAVAHPLDGFGALYPRREGTLAAGSIWSSSLYPARCPADEVLITTFVGGDQHPTAPDQPDEALLTAVDAELRRIYGITAAPTLRFLYRWPRAIPQFDALIQPVRAALPALAGQGLHVVANWAAGAGVPDVVAHAQGVAQVLIGRAAG